MRVKKCKMELRESVQYWRVYEVWSYKTYRSWLFGGSIRLPDSLNWFQYWQKFYEHTVSGFERVNEAQNTKVFYCTLWFCMYRVTKHAGQVLSAGLNEVVRRNLGLGWLHHIPLAGACCVCVGLSESAAAESRFPAENKPHKAKHQYKELHFPS